MQLHAGEWRGSDAYPRLPGEQLSGPSQAIYLR